MENKKNNKLNTQKDIPKNNQYNEQLLNFCFEQALDGVFFMMLDEPIIWDDNTDKEKTLDYIFAHQRVTKINDAMLSQYRAKSEDFLNLTPNDFFLHDLEQGRKVWRELFDNGKLHIDTAEKRFDGTDMIIDGDYICIYDDKKRILGHFGVQREVTLLRDAEQKLKSSEEKYRFIAENTSDGIVTFNKDFVITYCSPSYLNQLGYTDEEEIGRNNNDVKELLHPDDRESVFESIFNAIKNKHKDLHYSFRIKHKNGNYIWREDSAHFIYDENGEYNGSYVTCRDVTLRIELENEFKQNEAKYKFILENIYDLVYQFDLEGVFTFVSNSVTKLMGYELNEIIGHSFMPLTHPDDLQICLNAIHNSILTKENIVDITYRIKHKDGTWRWHESIVTPILGENGNVLYLKGIAREITKTKEKDDEIKRHYVNLLSVIENIDDIISLKDIDHKLIVFNENFEVFCKELFNIETSIGLKTIDFLPIEAQEHWYKILDNVLQGGTYKNQFTWDYGSGDIRYYDISHRPIIKDNNIVGYSEITRDVTIHKQNEAKLKEQNQILLDSAEKLKRKNNILDTINYLQNSLLTDTFSDVIFEEALSKYLELTDSEYGFIGEIIDANTSAPYLKTKAMTDISWNDETRKLYKESASFGLEFKNLQTLFGAEIKDQQPMIANNPSHHPKKGGLPDGHPELNAFLGLPLKLNQKMVGMIGISNRPNGYDEKLIAELEPLTSTIARLIDTHISKLTLKKVEEKTLSIIKSMDDIVFVLNKDLIYLEVHHSNSKDLLFEPLDFIGKSFFEVGFLEPAFSNILKKMNLCIETEITQDTDYYVDLPNGKQWFNLKVTPLKGALGKAEGLVCVVRNITGKKHQDYELESARNEAIKQSNYYRDLLENQSVYVIKTDMSGNYSYVNKHFELKFGFDGIVGSSSLQSIIDEDKNLCIEAVTKCLQNPEVGINVILRKKSTKTNEIITNYWEFKLVKNDKDELSEILCIGFDISDLYKAQIELKETINSLEEINNSLQNFAHIVSHNLRSHSANINGLLTLISIDYPDILINQYYDFLNKANDNLMETITHLSEVTQLHTNSKIDYYPVSLNKSLKNSIINIIGLAKNSGLKIINELYDNSIIIGEQSYIDSILLNFLTNAIKYRSNDKDSFVRISSYKENDKLVLVIEDNGLGIDLVRHRNKLFGMFKTFHEHPEARGIGLFITNNQVKALGGYIDVESQVGEGTTFKIYFMSGESI